MATQGVVSVVCNGKVVMKIVTGSDGNRAKSLASKIKEKWPVSKEEAFKLAKNLGLGNENSLVIVTEESIYTEICGNPTFFDHDEHPLCRETFQDPRFNPRWKRGTADHIEIIEV